MEQALLSLLAQCFENRGLEAGEVEILLCHPFNCVSYICGGKKIQKHCRVCEFELYQIFFFHFSCIYIHIFLLFK
ncbi:unnamed protein product, partial [Brassica rapa]